MITKNILGEEGIFSNELYDRDVLVRAVGYESGFTVYAASFDDPKGNKWLLSFDSMGEQRIRFLTPSVDDSKIIWDILPKCWKEDCGNVSNFLQALEEMFNQGQLPIPDEEYNLFNVFYKIEELGLVNWIFNSWFEPHILVKNLNGDIVIDSYVSNFILGEGVFSSIGEIDSFVNDKDSIIDFVETYSSFMKEVA